MGGYGGASSREAMTRGSRVHGRHLEPRRATGEPDPSIGWGYPVDRTLRTFHARLIRVWDHWVVEVPDASGVHALVLTPMDAEETARQAIAMILGVDPGSFQVIVEPA